MYPLFLVSLWQSPLKPGTCLAWLHWAHEIVSSSSLVLAHWQPWSAYRPTGWVCASSQMALLRQVFMYVGWAQSPVCPRSISEIMFLVLNWVFTVCNRSKPSIHFPNDGSSTGNLRIGLSIQCDDNNFNSVQIKNHFEWMLYCPLINTLPNVI